MLPRQYQFLFQRVCDHMANKFRGEMATIIFDEEHLHLPPDWKPRQQAVLPIVTLGNRPGTRPRLVELF